MNEETRRRIWAEADEWGAKQHLSERQAATLARIYGPYARRRYGAEGGDAS